jgi:hypothetical protein
MEWENRPAVNPEPDMLTWDASVGKRIAAGSRCSNGGLTTNSRPTGFLRLLEK